MFQIHRRTVFAASLAFGFGVGVGTAWATSFNVLHNFAGGPHDGANPYGGLALDKQGNVYGTTVFGGGSGCTGAGCGTVFEIAADGVESVLYTFSNVKNGLVPYGGLVLDAAGNLYGTTIDGGSRFYGGLGTVFEVAPGQGEHVLLKLGGRKGDHPVSSLIWDGAGNLYSTTLQGGRHDSGTIFRLAPDGSETMLYSFCKKTSCADGANPHSGVIFDTSGNLYGTTYHGGANNYGIVFKLTVSGKEKVLYSFGGGALPASPNAGVILDGLGNLYGTTETGGSSNEGTVYEITADGTFKLLHSFSGTDGATPYGGVILDGAGNIYGTVSAGGTYNDGAVYQLSPDGTLSLLHSFDGTDGSTPEASLVMDANGNLYGTSYSGGNYGSGVLFEIGN